MMWGIRAVRAALVLCGVAAALGGNGCHQCDCGRVDHKRVNELLYQSETHGPPGQPVEQGMPQKDEKGSRITTERIHGGIIE